MDIKRENLIPRVKNVQIEGSWVPATPVKPSVAISEPICSGMQENQFDQVNSLESERYLQGNQIGQTNWQESGKLSSGFLQEIRANGVPAHGKSTNFIDVNRGLDRWEDIEWHNLGFGELLALADASTGSSDPANVSRLLLGSKFQTNSNCEPDMPQYGCSIPPRPFFDLNITPLMTTAELISSQFEPVTPDPSKRAENNQVSDVRNSTVEERTNQARNEQATDIVEVDELHHETEQSQLNKNLSSCAAVSTQLQEDHNPDKGTDLNKTPQQKPRRKRHRPKVVREGKAARPQKQRTPKPENPTETPKVKRKYVRKKGLEKPLETTPGDSNPKILDSSPKSCRRSLNFDSETQVIDESSSCKPPSNIDSESHEQNIITRDESMVQIGQVMEVRVDNTQVGIAYDLTCSMNHVLKDYLSMPERLIPSPPTPSKIDDLHDKSMANTQNACTRGKCRIVFSDETHDKQASSVPIMSDTNIDSAPKGLKRGHLNINDEAELSNKIGSQCTSLQAYLAQFTMKVHNMEMTPGVHFPAIYKKKRTEKPNSSVTSSTLSTVTAMQNQTKIAEINGSQEKQHPFNCMLALGPAEKSKGKRSKVTTRVRDLTSLIGMVGGKQSPNSISRGATTSNIVERFEISQKPHTCMDALAADTRVTKARKKRTKRNPLASTMPPNMHNHQQFGSKSKGSPPGIMWKGIPYIDELVERFRHLDINAKSNQVVVRGQNALVPINVKYQEQNALVLYQRDGTVVPFEGSFDPVKKRRPRPKVDLDEETTRVWKLLLQDINSQGIDGTDEEKEKWWEEERRVFRGRADSFIARMHLVQGDRRFTMWKGSVVDSVVGVFLTQNVSDHLSSSAFMSLAAQFPPKSNVNYGPSDEERTTGLVQEPEVCVQDPDETIGWHGDKSNQPACDQSSYSEEKEAINSSESFGSSTNINCKLFDYSTNGLQIYHESAVCRSTTHITGEVASCMGDQRETDDVISSQNSLVSSQNSVDSSMAQTAERTGSCSQSYSEAEVIAMSKPKSSFVELLQKVTGTTMLNRENNQDSGHMSSSNLQFLNPTSRHVEVECFDVLGEESRFSGIPKKNGEYCASEQSGLSAESVTQATIPQIMTGGSQETSKSPSEISDNLEAEVNKALKSRRIAENLKNKGETFDVTESTNISKAQRNIAREKKNARIAKEKESAVDWDSLRKQAQASGKREREAHTMDSVDWETIRCSDIDEIAHTIRERGMNNMLAARIKAFLNRLVRDHGSIDLEWLRDVPPDKAKEYLLSIRGLGLKSVECVRLLTLHHLAFPVDTNVGRIAVRLGWVPLQPLPESLQLHLLELYPILESIQKYLWPRLCKLDQRTLYELHYQMITFGKVFCTKSKPNCNACPMRGECRHFASAFASARLALPAPEEKGLVSSMDSIEADHTHTVSINRLQLPPPQQLEMQSQIVNCIPIIEEPVSPEPIIELPATPEPERIQIAECDIEDACGDPDEIPTIKLDIEEFTQNLQNYMQQNMELQEGDVSKALVALTPEAASIPMPKLKNVSRLRTEHNVYELPDSHPLLEGLDKREPDDPCSYLLAIWTPGETPDSIQPPEGGCNSQETGKLCDNETCFSCNNIREANSQTVRGTLLIPCRTAMRGSFPLNGTYFQVNEVFADHESSLNPIDVPRSWIWNLPRRTVYFGTSIPTIFKGLSTEGIQYCFWRGFVCVRGFDQKTRAPRPLMARLHFPASKLVTTKGKPSGS